VSTQRLPLKPIQLCRAGRGELSDRIVLCFQFRSGSIYSRQIVLETKCLASLDAVSGAVKGTSFQLADGSVSLGRDPSNDIAILETSVSRRHCIVEGDGRHFTIRDLDSRNSTFVNGVPIKERVLEHRDEIRVGNSIFLFTSETTSSADSSLPVRLSDLRAGNSTIILRKEQVRYLNPLRPLDDAGSRAVRELDVLLNISTALNALRQEAAIIRRVLESVLDVAPVDRAAILFWDISPDEIASAIALDRRSRQECPVEVSRTVVAQVAREGIAILSTDVAADEHLDSAESLILRRVRCLVAVPLEMFGRTMGVLYLDSTDPHARIDVDLLQFVTAIGGIASIAIENARRIEQLESENERLKAEINIEHDMVGESARVRDVYQFISKVAPTDSTVLVWGESGTGKELVARAIHRNSSRVHKPFVAINCAAIAETLLESELFGHEKGAFTGAVSQRKGRLEAAEGGTVFLDEIGELPLALQAKLLRVLQEREFERLGSNRPIKLNVRLIAATNRDLQQAIKTGTFRQDLFYRLNVVAVRMPALRERREDIPLLATYFATKCAERSKRKVTGLSTEARACLMNHDWPGNVRELENAIERAVVMGSTAKILAEDLPEELLEKPAIPGTVVTRYHEGVLETKKQIILRAIEQAEGHYVEAAKLLGVHPNYLHRLMRNLNLKGSEGG
jgi:transcriptional regulator with GAF, ATPase, and Fis domain